MDELKIIPTNELFFGNPIKYLLLPIRARIEKLFYLALGLAIGLTAWDTFLPLAVFLPVVWAKAPTKKIAWLTGLVYHLAASRGLIFGVPVFFDSTLVYGVVLWVIAGLIQSFPYFLCSLISVNYNTHRTTIKIPEM